MVSPPTTQDAETAAVVKSVRRAKPWEAQRDRQVLDVLLADWNDLPESLRPDLMTWLNGASSALLVLRGVSS